MHPYEQGVLNPIHNADRLSLSIALRYCRSGVMESIATDPKCSVQNIGIQSRSPLSTVDDCHRPMLEAIGHEIMQRA